MGSALKLRGDHWLASFGGSANDEGMCASAAGCCRSLRLDGLSRADAARLGGMDRQTLRDWVHRFDAEVPKVLSINGRLVRRRVCRPSSKPTWPLSSKRGRTVLLTASCTGGTSI